MTRLEEVDEQLVEANSPLSCLRPSGPFNARAFAANHLKNQGIRSGYDGISGRILA